MRVIRQNTVCDYEGCVAAATTVAHDPDRNAGPGGYCDVHAEMVVDHQAPEFLASCPNCGCRFGVN